MKKFILFLSFMQILIAGYAQDAVVVRYKATKDIPTTLLGIDIGSGNMDQQAIQQGYRIVAEKVYAPQDNKSIVCFNNLSWDGFSTIDNNLMLIAGLNEDMIDFGRLLYLHSINILFSPAEKPSDAYEQPKSCYVWNDSKGNSMYLFFESNKVTLMITIRQADKRNSAVSTSVSNNTAISSGNSNIQTIPHKDGTYVGSVVNGKKHGYGVFTGFNGDVYEGNYVNDQKNGQGKYTWSTGGKYEGNWKNGYMDGQGKYTWSNGDSHNGNWKNDKRDGYGVYTFSDGTIKKGYWKDDKYIGTEPK